MSREQMEKELNSGRFFLRIERKDRKRILQLGVDAVKKKENFISAFTMILDDGQKKEFFMKGDIVEDDISDVKCILSIRCE